MNCLHVLLTGATGVSLALAGGHGGGAMHARNNALLPSGGLLNLGNTCYLNAQLEAAYHVPRVRELVMNPSSSKSRQYSDDPAEGGGAQQTTIGLQALGEVFRAMQEASLVGLGDFTAPTSTSVLCRNLGINTMEQQDSQEFWKLLLPELCLPPLVDIYQGAYEEYILALDGSGRERRREEPFLDLSLEVSSGSIFASLEDLFSKPELLSEKEGNGWRPEKGADRVDALKGSLLRVQGLPSLLQLHLKRFNYDWQSHIMSKINDRFSFPKVLDLSPLCTDIKKNEMSQAVYDLQSVIVHVGEFGSGHYYAYVRPDIQSNVWYRFDDDKVSEVSFHDVRADAFGGRLQNDDKKQGIFSKILGFGASSFGWGGRSSSAYMLQYVRRCDSPSLYSTPQ